MRIYQLVKTMSEKIDKKKNSETGGKDTPVSMDYSGIDTKVISELKRIGVLNEIENTFKDRAAMFIKNHIYMDNSGKLIVKSLSKDFREYVIGIKIHDLSFGSAKYIMANKFIVIKIANHDSVYDMIENNMAKITDFVIKKQKNGSFRLANLSKTGVEFEIQ